MSNSYYNHASAQPGTGTAGASAIIRSEFDALTTAFNLLPTLSGGNAGQVVYINATGTALISSSGLAFDGSNNATFSNNVTVNGTSTLTGLVTATAGVTTPANLTTTGSGALSINGVSTLTGLVTATAGVTTPANLTTTGSGALTIAGVANITGLVTSSTGFSTGGNYTTTGSGALSIAGASTLTGLVTATAGVTTPANLTTTGSGALSVAGNATIGGTNVVTGSETAARFIVTGATVATNGLYLSGANQVSLSTNSLEVLRATSSQQIQYQGDTASFSELGFRGAPQVSVAGAGSTAAVVAWRGLSARVSGSSTGITINASTFSAGDMFLVVNTLGGNVTLTAGASVTFQLSGTASTGNRTLAQKGIATVYCDVGGATPTFILGGSGLT